MFRNNFCVVLFGLVLWFAVYQFLIAFLCSGIHNQQVLHHAFLLWLSNTYTPLDLPFVTMGADKLGSEDKSEHPIWELTNPVPLNDDGSSAEALLGNNPDVHFIYICTKVGDNKFPISPRL